MTTTTSLADNVNDSLELVYQLFPQNLEYEYEIDSKNEELTVKIFVKTKSGYGRQIGQIEQTTNGYAAYDAVWGWTSVHSDINSVIDEMQMKMVCMTQLY